MKIEILNSSSNAYVDITPYLITSQVKCTRKDKSGGNAMTMQDGSYYRDRIASKWTWDLPFKLLTTAQLQLILGLLQPQYFAMRVNPDPSTGAASVGTYYVETAPAAYQVKRQDGTEYWAGVAVSAAQR